MSLWNPHTFTPLGQPMAPAAPPSLRVMDRPATASQLSAAQAGFARFCGQSRLGYVPNPTEAGRLPDGSRYRIVTVGANSTMEIWPVGGEDLVIGDVLHGVVRRLGIVDLDPVPAGSYKYKEFHECGTEGYAETAKFFTQTKDGVVEMTSSPLWKCFAGDIVEKWSAPMNGQDTTGRGLSGPAAKLAQFGRGAVLLYEQYLRKKKLPVAGRSLGDGVFVAGEGSDRRSYCYRIEEVGNTFVVRAVQMEVAPKAKFCKGPIPKEIRALFGDGAPIPPTEPEWAEAAVVETLRPSMVSSSSIVGVGCGTSAISTYSGHDDCFLLMNFPRMASTGNGKIAHTLLFGYENLAPGGFNTSCHTTLNFSHAPSGAGFSPTCSISYGVVGRLWGSSRILMPPAIRALNDGTYANEEFSGVCGITHVDNTLTKFTKHTKTCSDIAAEINVSVSGGLSRNFMVYWYGIKLDSYSDNFSGGETVSNIGGWVFQHRADISTFAFLEYSGYEVELLRSFGIEGAFQTTRMRFYGGRTRHQATATSYYDEYYYPEEHNRKENRNTSIANPETANIVNKVMQSVPLQYASPRHKEHGIGHYQLYSVSSNKKEATILEHFPRGAAQAPVGVDPVSGEPAGAHRNTPILPPRFPDPTQQTGLVMVWNYSEEINEFQLPDQLESTLFSGGVELDIPPEFSAMVLWKTWALSALLHRNSLEAPISTPAVSLYKSYLGEENVVAEIFSYASVGNGERGAPISMVAASGNMTAADKTYPYPRLQRPPGPIFIGEMTS